jgi:tyrosyl-tRNA synthetase
MSRAEVHRNGDWFGRMSFADVLGLCGRVTVAQLLTREDFARRYREERAIFLHECLYPVMQAWDSVEIRADVELGGTEQLYSFMLARDLQAQQGLSQQIAVMSPILVGLDGVRRMGKSLGNYIGISEPAYEMMKKFMQLPDGVMRMYFELLTELPMDEVDRLLAGHLKEAKVALATNVISQYHSAEAAVAACQRWQAEIGGEALPSDIPDVALDASLLTSGTLSAVRLLTALGLCTSNSEARRLIEGGGARTGPEKSPITTHDQQVSVSDGLLVWAGRKKYCRVRIG